MAGQRTFPTPGEFAQCRLFCKELLDSEQNNLLPKALQRHVWANRAALTEKEETKSLEVVTADPERLKSRAANSTWSHQEHHVHPIDFLCE